MKVAWDQRAIADLEGILEYIAEDRPSTARRVIDHIRQRVETLPATPHLGAPSDWPGIRQLVLSRYPYLILYRPTEGGIEVLAVFHHKQQRR